MTTMTTTMMTTETTPMTMVAVRMTTESRTPFVQSWRGRMLGWFVMLLAVASLSSLFILRLVTLVELENRIDADLAQEAEELRALALGNDPETGEPFGDDAAAIFRTFLLRSIPNEHEVFIAIIDGEPVLRSSRQVALRLDLDPVAVSKWASIAGSERGEIETPAGAVDYLAVELVGSEVKAVFVAARFSDLLRTDVERPILLASAVGGALGLVVASVLAWVLAEKMVKPVSDMTDTVRSITAGDLTNRVPVAGDDELARLAQTFNEMLDRLQDAFETQRRFLADAGHELRTPITVVRGHLELMGDDPDERESTRRLVTEELDRMGRMVEELLTLARSERPDFLDRRWVDLDEMVKTTFRKMQALGDVDWRLGPVAVGIALLDAGRIGQALLALADNAVGHGGATITLGSEVTDGQLRLSVHDTGPGISDDDLDGLFDRFHRGRGSRGRPGSGLGLAIVRSIALAHGGDVEVESTLGEGTTFTVRVPVSMPEPEHEEAEGDEW
jgi:two-component system, OmpR family, sensor kinase